MSSFSQSVDAAILNFMNRVTFWGAVADNYSYKAVNDTSKYLNTDIGALRLPKPTQVKFKKFNPSSLDVFKNLPVNNISNAIKQNLTDFFIQNFSNETLFNRISFKVIQQLTTKNIDVDEFKIYQLVSKATLNTNALGNDDVGLKKPPQSCSINTSVEKLFPISLYEQTLISLAKISFWKFLLSVEMKDLRREALMASSNYIATVMEAQSSLSSIDKKIASSEIELQQALYRMYSQYVESFFTEAKVNYELQDFDVSTKILTTNFYTDMIGLTTGAAASVAKDLSSLVQSAVSASNSVLSISTVGFGD